jgi:riboflavin kinase/FMN adenylyltransferase
MRLLRSLECHHELRQGTVATIGNFDGVHLGHQALLTKLSEKAKALGCPMLVILFEPQPGEYFSGDNAPPRLTSIREKLAFLKQCQVDYVLCLKFNKRLAEMDANTFAKRYLFSGIFCKYLLTGEDFRFAYQRSGDIHLLKQLGKKYHCEVDVFKAFVMDELRVSSTKVREALMASDFALAERYLGRKYSLCGRVVRGAGLGRQWGIPTANIKLNKRRVPLKGVYLVDVLIEGKYHQGLANIGSRPTVDGSKKCLEVHLLNFDEAIYGKIIEVFFLHKLRDEVKFQSVEMLIEQIKNDIAQARHFFENHNEKKWCS